MKKYACIDVGGTFTDAAILDENGNIMVFKSPTTPHDYTEGIISALKVAANHYGIEIDDFLKDISVNFGGMMTHGSTIATNAIVEGKVGKIGVLCTDGFRDVFLFREGPNKDPFDFDLDYPEPYVPRYLTLPIRERVNSEGGVVIPLNEDDVRAGTRTLRSYCVEAICVCFLWSTVNPDHESRAAEIIHEEWPEIQVVLSCEVNPSSREYRRWVSAAIDASLRKLVSVYALDLNEKLAALGFIGEVGMLNSCGGVMSTAEIVKKPIFSIDSGPSMAPVSGKIYAMHEIMNNNVVVLDMGGTTFDVSCVIGGEISASREAAIGNEIPGISRVNVHSIGAGGGSIAWVDSGSMVRVGPVSACSVPGPACYNQGGTMPTVTDANVVLGYLNPDFFNNGMMKLCPELSYTAIKEHIADKLGISVLEAAYTIWSTVNANMIAAIKDITIWQGVDPRNYIMVAGGGACGLHAIPLMEGLEMNRLLIPHAAGGLSAVGGILSDTVAEFSANCFSLTNNFNFDAVNAVLQNLVGQVKDFFARNNVEKEIQDIQVYMEGHYPSQVWELSVNITGYLNDEYCLEESSIKSLEQAFHNEHEHTFTFKEDTFIECLNWRVKAIGKNELSCQMHEEEYHEDNVISLKNERFGSRKVYFREYGELFVTPVYLGENLFYGDIVQGPAIIEEPTTTIVVLPDYSLKVTKYGNYYIKNIKYNCCNKRKNAATFMWKC